MAKSKKLSDFRQQAMNANKHTERGMKALEASMNEIGYTAPMIAAADGEIIAGSARHETAANVFGADVEPVVVESDGKRPIVVVQTDIKNAGTREAKRIGLLDNRVQQIDLDFDAEVLAQLYAEDKTLTAGLWSDDELTELFNEGVVAGDGDAEPQIDKAAELNKIWQVKEGDLWQIGEHRLLCGDSTKREDVGRVMMGEKAAICFTDPPYGVGVGKKNVMLNSFQPSGRNLTDIVDDDLSPDELKLRLLPAFINLREIVMSEDCTVFMTAPQNGELSMMMMMMMKDAGLTIRHVLIWKKNAPTFSMGRLDYDYQHEPILLTWGKRHKRPMLGAHKTSVWEINKPRSSAEHPTMKPPELYENAYLNNSEAGDIAYEPYSGSGTAFVAAQNTSRKCRGIEISPDYCAVILQRMKDAFPNIEIKRHE